MENQFIKYSLISEQLGIIATQYVKFVSSKIILVVAFTSPDKYELSSSPKYDFNGSCEVDSKEFNYHFIRAMSSLGFDEALKLIHEEIANDADNYINNIKNAIMCQV